MAAKSAYLNARIDPALKTEAEGILAALDVSPSQAISMFYRQVVLRRGLPFEVGLPNADTLAAVAQADAGGGEVVRGSTADAFDAVLGDDHTRGG